MVIWSIFSVSRWSVFSERFVFRLLVTSLVTYLVWGVFISVSWYLLYMCLNWKSFCFFFLLSFKMGWSISLVFCASSGELFQLFDE